MAIEFRGPNRRPYYYRSERVGNIVRRRYVAAGDPALAAAASDRAERATARVRRAEEQREKQRRFEPVGDLLVRVNQTDALLRRLRTCYCAAAGWVLHHRQWRKAKR